MSPRVLSPNCISPPAKVNAAQDIQAPTYRVELLVETAHVLFVYWEQWNIRNRAAV
jgi:hypothetical protein